MKSYYVYGCIGWSEFSTIVDAESSVDALSIVLEHAAPEGEHVRLAAAPLSARQLHTGAKPFAELIGSIPFTR